MALYISGTAFCMVIIETKCIENTNSCEMPDVLKITELNGIKYKSVKQNEIQAGFLKEEENNRGSESNVLKQIKITICVILGNLMLGFTVAWPAPVAAKLKNVELSPLPYPILDKEVSWIVSTTFIGSVFGANAGGYIANIIGRKYTMMLFSFTHMIGYIVIACARNYAAILVGRTMAGVAGAIAVLNLVYLGEIASPNIRGSLLTMSGIFHVCGSLMVYSIGPYVSFAKVCYVCIAISCVHILALCFIPESPVYYLIKGKETEAKTTLRKLGRSQDIDKELRPMIEDMYDTFLHQAKDEPKLAPVSKWKQLISEKKNRKAFLITTILFCLQCGGGVVAVLFFATTIFINAQSSVDPNIATIILGVTELCGVMLTPLLVERFGRRILLLISTGFCSLSMGSLGTYFYLEETQESIVDSIRWLPLVSLVTCLFTFNIGLGIIPNTLIGEMYSPRLRSTGSSISMTLAWSVALITGSTSFGYIVAALHNHGVFWLYAGINALGFFFTVFVVPETKGKTLMEIGYMLDN